MNEKNNGGISMEEPILKSTIGFEDEKINEPSSQEAVSSVDQTSLAEPVLQIPVVTEELITSPVALVEAVQVPTEDDGFYYVGAYKLKYIENKLSDQDNKIAATILEYVDCGRTAEALKMAQEFCDRNISNEIAWYCNASTKMAVEDYAAAYYAYQQAIAINDKFANAYEEYGYALAANKDFRKAQECFEAAHIIDPDNIYYMADIARNLINIEDVDASIEKFRYFIDIASEKTVLENMLGEVLVDSCLDLTVDIPLNLDDPNGEKVPGFLTLEDIELARKRSNEALSLLTLSSSEEAVKLAHRVLEQCDLDCELERCHRKSFIIFHTVMSAIFTFFATCLTMGIYLPFGIIMTYATYKADFFPTYWFNYAFYTGSDDPFQYKKDKFRNNFRNKHEILQGAIDGGKEGWNSVGSSSSSVGGALLSGIVGSYIKNRFWLMKARIEFYKRFIKKMQEKKNKSIDKI